MKSFVGEPVLGASIELGGFEAPASEGLMQEPPLLLGRAHLGLLKHFIDALLFLVNHWYRYRYRRRRLSNFLIERSLYGFHFQLGVFEGKKIDLVFKVLHNCFIFVRYRFF